MAERYWVNTGGTGTWDGTALLKWSATSGGLGGEAVPTAGDNVYFDQNSGTGVVTVATTAGLGLNIDFSAGTGYTGTLAGSTGITCSGNFTLGAATVWTNTGTLTLNATSGVQVIKSNGTAFTCPITRSGASGAAQLFDNLTTGITRTFTLTDGDLDLNGKVLSAGIFSSNNANTRSITPNGGSITLTATSGTLWTTATVTNFTLSAALTLTAPSGGAGVRTFSCAGLTEANAPSINVTAGTDSVAQTGSVTNLNFTGFAGGLANGARTIYGSLTLAAGMTSTDGASIQTFAGTSGTKMITTNGVTLGGPITFNGVGSTWQLVGSDITQTATRALLTTNGTLDLNGYKITGGLFVVDDAAVAGGNANILRGSVVA